MVDLSNIVQAEAAAKRAGVCTHGAVVRGQLDNYGRYICAGCHMKFDDFEAQQAARWKALDPYL
jgi:hypothetical protein